MPPEPTPDLASADVSEVVDELRQAHAGGKGRRSALYLWLRENHQRLTEEFDRIGPAWETLAASLGTRGILDGRRKPPTARGARDAWYRVREDMRAEVTKRAAGSGSPPGDIAPGVRTVPPPPPSTPLLPPAPPPEEQRQDRSPPARAPRPASLLEPDADDGAAPIHRLKIIGAQKDGPPR